ncbi:MAG: RtcB family protein [Candidatus Omnitrophota bacterium]
MTRSKRKKDNKSGDRTNLSSSARESFEERETPALYRRWGDNLDPESIEQMERACRLPISLAGALMPDAHVGYGLPIGGVLAARNAVIPYAVGVDIACRMKMTVLDLPPQALEKEQRRLIEVLERETRFGIGAEFKSKRQHNVMDRDWNISKTVREIKDKAWAQLGTSGSGNHFVEYGLLEIEKEGLALPPGAYLALLSHSGSRGAGNQIASHYSRLARDLHPELPKELVHLAWLDLDGEAGMEYWRAMELMGEYAAANHALIHRHIAASLGVPVLLDIENHHNFAWKEMWNGEQVIVHRKGATPAHQGVLGIIPGSMASPAYIVRGKGEPASLHSAAHGAGRLMSRKRAKEQFNWPQLKKRLDEQGVTLLTAGLDEAPMAYKNIEEVMAAQSDLVETLARFHPRIVKMAPAGEQPED